jgi:hypothetical protein
MQQIADPPTDRIHVHLCAFAFEKAEHIEIAVTLSELRPELAYNLHHRLDLGVIHLDLLETLTRLPHLGDKLRTIDVIEDLSCDSAKAVNLWTAAERSSQAAWRLFQDVESFPSLEKVAE